MKYIQIPNPVVLRRLDEQKKPIVYGMRMLNEENVFGKPVWREAGKHAMLQSIYEKFEASEYKPGVYVGLSDEEFEVYSPLAVMRGQELAPDVAVDLTRVMSCVLLATSSLPKAPEATATESSATGN